MRVIPFNMWAGPDSVDNTSPILLGPYSIFKEYY